MTAILSFLATKVGRIIIGVLGVGALVGAFALDQRSRGAQNAVAKIERQQTDAIRNANKAGSASRDPAARGVRDPYTRTDN